jgi:hypothetical protein
MRGARGNARALEAVWERVLREEGMGRCKGAAETHKVVNVNEALRERGMRRCKGQAEAGIKDVNVNENVNESVKTMVPAEQARARTEIRSTPIAK